MSRRNDATEKEIQETEVSINVTRRKPGPFRVNINLEGEEPVISGSVSNCYASPNIFQDVTQLGSNYWLNGNIHSACASGKFKKSGFPVRRFLPRASDPVLADAYLLERRLLKASSLDEFLGDLEYRERQAYKQSSDANFNQVKTFFSERSPIELEINNSTSSLRHHNVLKMSEERAGGELNPAFDLEDADTPNDALDNEEEPAIQITRFGGRYNDDDSEEVVTISKEIEDDNDNSEVKETVLDILKKSQNIEEKSKEAEDTRIPISDNNDLSLNNFKFNQSNNYEKRNTYTVSNNDDVDHDVTRQSSNDDVKIIIPGYDSEIKKKPAQYTQSVPLNGVSSKNDKMGTSKNLSASVRMSLKKAEDVPPLDPKDEDTKWLSWIELKFKEIAGDDGQIDLDEFKKALGVKKSFFAERFFELFDQDSSGTIELDELMDGLRMLTKGTPAQKLRFLFDVYDADASESIEREELLAVLRACMEESSLSLTQENLEDLTDALFDAADEDESGTITFDELRAELEKHPGVIENLTISAAQWLKPPDGSRKKKSGFRYFTTDYWRNNYKKVGYFIIYWMLNIALYAYAMWQYRESNTWTMFARGAGLCLNFNCMWVLVLMLRKSLTFLRMTKLVHILPLDQNILFHKMTAWTIAFMAFVHTFAHIGNAAHAANAGAMEMWEVLFTDKAGVGYVGGSAFITGWMLDIILIIMVICSMEFVRRGGHFQIFYWTHMLYVGFWILVILHGPHFWKWFIVPGILFIMEKISRSKFIKMARYGETYIEEVNLLPSGVTHLVVTRPTNFRYKPGDYIFIQIPEIAAYEWHPFTISSAPEMEGYIWLHVRSAGHWTNKLYKHFDTMEAPEDEYDPGNITESRRKTTRKFENFERAYSRRTTNLSKSSRGAASRRGQKPKQKHKLVKVKCYVDGPYGTGTREVFDTEHAVLVGAGIGVTPMASILQSVWYRFNAVRQTCPQCEHIWYPEEDTGNMKLQKVDFIWINRDQKSFEWFLTLLNQIELEQTSHHGVLENSIQMHMYMTAAQKKTDMKGIGLQIALDLMYDKSQRDLITGLRTKTEPGRPDWNKIFKSIKAENKGKVKVFFCGAPALGKTVKEMSAKFGFSFSKENF